MSSLNQRHSSRIVDNSGGTNQVHVRAYNERLVMSLVRRHQSLPKSEIARRSGLTPQTVSVIMRSLEKDGLLLRGAPRRGKVGQPSIPMSLNPDGALSIGLKVGRRSADLILIDFLGRILKKRSFAYNYPVPEELIGFTMDGIDKFQAELSHDQQRRIAGIGIAMPFELWNWAEKVDAPQADMDAWRDFSFHDALSEAVDFPIYVQNDATAACGAELIFGHGSELRDFVYIFIGTFIGSGIVLNHSVYAGRTGNAGSMGSMPMGIGGSGAGTLIDHASIFNLETKLEKSSRKIPVAGSSLEKWLALGRELDDWIEEAATHLASAIVASCSLIDFEAVIVDGAFPSEIRNRIVELIVEKLKYLDTRGIENPNVLKGTVGEDARAIGGASLPLLSEFLLDQSVLFKELS